MVRCKLPSGIVTGPQLEQLAHVADLIHLMADAGLTTRESRDNPVRPIPEGYLDAVAQYYRKLSQTKKP
jgi:hypothetical protein